MGGPFALGRRSRVRRPQTGRLSCLRPWNSGTAPVEEGVLYELVVELLKSGSFRYDSAAAADALGKIGPDAREVIPALITALRSDHPYTGLRTSAAAAVGKIGPDAREAVPALIDTLDGASYYLLSATSEALTQLTGQDFGDDAPAWRRWWDQAQP